MAQWNHIPPQESQWTIPTVSEYGRSEWIITSSNVSQESLISNQSAVTKIRLDNIKLNDTNEQKESKTRKSDRWRRAFHFFLCKSCISTVIQAFLLGVLLGLIVLAIVIAVWLTSIKSATTTSVPMTSTVTSVTTVTTTSTTSTSTSASTTSSTSSSTTSSTSSSTTTTGCMPSEFGNLSRVDNSNSWDEFLSNFTATKTTHLLVFGFQKTSSGNVFLDDVSVVDVNNPSSELIKNPSFQNSTVVPPPQWVSWCQASCIGGTGEGGVIITSGCHGGGGSYCYQGACTGGYLLLGQEFSAIIGNKYRISFWAQITGSGCTLSLDVL